MISNIKLHLEGGAKVSYSFEKNSPAHELTFDSESDRHAFQTQNNIGIEWQDSKTNRTIIIKSNEYDYPFCPTIDHESLLICNFEGRSDLALYSSDGTKRREFTLPSQYSSQGLTFDRPDRFLDEQGKLCVGVWLMNDYSGQLTFYQFDVETGSLGKAIRKSRM